MKHGEERAQDEICERERKENVAHFGKRNAEECREECFDMFYHCLSPFLL